MPATWRATVAARRLPCIVRRQERMGYFDRQYEVFVLLGAPFSSKLWEESQWLPLAENLGQFAESSRGRTAVRTYQNDVSGKDIAFGRLAWNPKSHRRWTHSSAQHSNQATFHYMEVWAPAWTICWRENMSPDFFFNLLNPDHLNNHSQHQFNQVVVCALAQDLGPSRATALQSILRSWAATLSAPVFARKSRPWGISSGHLGGYTDVIEHMALLHLFKVGNPHERPLDRATFSEPWEFLQRFDA